MDRHGELRGGRRRRWGEAEAGHLAARGGADAPPPISPPSSPHRRPPAAASTPTPQKAAQTAKEGLDRKFGPSWHCVIGEGFAYQVAYQARNTLFCYYAEKLGVLVWKA